MHTGNENIQDYIQSFKRGEEKGFSYFFKTLYPSLLFYAFRIVKDKIPAEDIVEESFIKIWERHKNFEDAGKLKSWLYATVRNACFDYLRLQQKEKQGEDSMAILQAGDVVPDTLEHIISAEVTGHIYNVLLSLPPRCQEVLKHLFIDGMTLGEVADVMKVSINTVKNQRARGLELIRKRAILFSCLFVMVFFMTMK